MLPLPSQTKKYRIIAVARNVERSLNDEDDTAEDGDENDVPLPDAAVHDTPSDATAEENNA